MARTLEMGFFSLIYPFMSQDRKRGTVLYNEIVEKKLKELRDSSKGVLFLLPHVALFEALVTSPYFRPQKKRKLGAIFRPNKNPRIDKWIDGSRTSNGLITFSRKEGLLKAKTFLKDGNWLVLLFDQNAGDRGVLDLFLGRLVSYTPLPISLQKATKASPVFVLPQRIGFFKTKLSLSSLSNEMDGGCAADAHLKLEETIRSHADGFPEWLWCHGKWKIHSRVESRYRMIVKRKHLISKKKIARKTPFCVRMPNWLGDVIMAIPVLQAIRAGRPDVRFTLVCKSQFIPLLKKFSMGEEFISLPEEGIGYFGDFRKLFKYKPENYLLFTNSLRGDVEACLTGCAQRFGIKLGGRPRPLLTNYFDPHFQNDNNSNEVHQTELWEQMARHFGLRETVSKEPFLLSKIRRQKMKIGFIPGSSNSPEKRWSSANWVSLIERLISVNCRFTFHLYGTSQDNDITSKISSILCSPRVKNNAGVTDLFELADELASCALVIGNDTGSIHLANMVGTPVVVLFGPTNSIKTKPFFKSGCTILHSTTNDINDLDVDDVMHEINYKSLT
tara:strand:- start:473 stop:2146 length:1674 start_codon:yes stop_codon:yes gene_type:complete